MIDSKDISVVVQGPIYQNITEYCLESIRKYLPNAQIILSTYKNSNLTNLKYDILVENEDCGNYSADLYDKRYNNTNRQIMTTKSGLVYCNRKYTLRIRTDLSLSSAKFLKYFAKLSFITDTKYKVFNKKIIVLTLFTRHFIGNGSKRYETPFHISDWIQFGLTEDIKKVWDIPLQQEPDFSRYFETKPERQKFEFGTRTWKFPPEQYLWLNVFSKHDKKVYMKDLLDYNEEIIKLSESYIKNNFIILRPNDFSIEMDKYNLQKLQDFDETSLNSYYKADELILDKIKKSIFYKQKNKNRRTITILGIKISYKKKPKIKTKVNPANIRMVEIEIFSYCNRRCWFCPNSFIDRHSKNILMDEKLYLKILNELKSINYSKKISYSRYNEPTANKEVFLKRLRQAKEILPKALLHTNTNGDFLTREYLDEIYEAGLRSMNIQCYLKQDENFDIENIKQRIDKTAKKLNLDYKMVCEKQDRCEVKFDYKDMNLRMYARDFKINGNNRGGSLKSILPQKRTRSCPIPSMDIYIDYNGAVMPCCNFRSDIKTHKKFILGNAKITPILKIFNNKKIQCLRKILSNDNITISPCNECNF